MIMWCGLWGRSLHWGDGRGVLCRWDLMGTAVTLVRDWCEILRDRRAGLDGLGVLWVDLVTGWIVFW